MATGWSSEMTIWIAWCEWAGTTPLAWPISRKPPSHRYQRGTFNHRYDASFNCWFTGAPVPNVAVLLRRLAGAFNLQRGNPRYLQLVARIKQTTLRSDAYESVAWPQESRRKS